MDKFTALHHRTPRELTIYLQENRITLTRYSQLSSIPVSSLGKQLKAFGVEPFKPPAKRKTSFRCVQCGGVFTAYDRPSRQGRNVYCSAACRHTAARKVFDERCFRVRDYTFAPPGAALGDYQAVALGSRQRLFVNRDKVDHFFFRQGIRDEATAYVFGVMLTDGSLGRDRKGTYYLRLQMTDADIVGQVSVALRNKNRLRADPKRRTSSLIVTSPYLYHDLSALGCVPNKTYVANYPLVSDDLDRHLIRGIVDGDGSWVVGRSRPLSLQVCGNDLLLFGLYCKILRHTGATPQSVQYPADFDPRIKMKTFCNLRYNTADSIKVREWMYEGATLYGERKRRTAFSAPPPYAARITTPKLAALLGVAPDFIKRAAKREALPHRSVGPYRYFEEEHIPAWIEFLKSKLRNPKCKLPNRAELAARWLPSEAAE